LVQHRLQTQRLQGYVEQVRDGNPIEATELESCRKKTRQFRQLAPRDTQLRGFYVFALEDRQSFARSKGCEPTGVFAPFKGASTVQHDAGVFAAHKPRLNRFAIGWDRSFLKLFESF